MTGRRYGGGPAPRGGGWRRADRGGIQRPAGSLAWFDGTCDRCDQPIQRLVHQIVERHHAWIHTHCSSGADDE